MKNKKIILNTSGLTKRFGGLCAVDHIDLNLNEGEILGLIGPNGSGKTTLVNLISGNIMPTSGEIRFKNRSIKGLKSFQIGRIGIARTYQLVKPFPGMTVLENIAVGAMYGRKRKQSIKQAFKKAEEILDFSALSRYSNYRADQLSIASRKRLEMAKVIAMDPEIVFFDEVMAGLNHHEIDQSIEMIRKIREQGISILIIEHVMRAITAICDRIFVIHHGKEIAQGIPEQVMTDPEVISAYLGNRYRDNLLSKEVPSDG